MPPKPSSRRHPAKHVTFTFRREWPGSVTERLVRAKWSAGKRLAQRAHKSARSILPWLCPTRSGAVSNKANGQGYQVLARPGWSTVLGRLHTVITRTILLD